MAILGDRHAVEKTSPMPVNDITMSTDQVSVTGETVTIAAGAAGTAVAVTLDKAPIYNSTGDRVGDENNSSLSFTTGTTLTTEVGIDYRKLEELRAGKTAAATVITEMTSKLANGEYVVDYENGIIFGVKADTGTSDTAAYTTRAQTAVVVTSGGESAPGTHIFDEDTAHTDGDAGVHVLTVRDDVPVAKAGTDGDYQSLTTDDVGALWARIRGYDTSADANKNFNTNPDSSNYIGETLATVTNETSGTNYYYVDMDSFKFGGWQIATSDTTPTDTLTITVEATLQDDGTAAASCDYDDVTNDLFGVASWVDQDVYLTIEQPFAAKFIRIKTVTAGGNDDADYTIYHKRMY